VQVGSKVEKDRRNEAKQTKEVQNAEVEIILRTVLTMEERQIR
jgi:hypothetical protein